MAARSSRPSFGTSGYNDYGSKKPTMRFPPLKTKQPRTKIKETFSDLSYIVRNIHKRNGIIAGRKKNVGFNSLTE